MIFLNIPFDDKEEAKQLGARWHTRRNQWFIPEELDESRFKKWLPDYEEEFTKKALCPFYLIKATNSCWKCGTLSEVITFASEGEIYNEDGVEEVVDEFMIYGYVSLLPPKLASLIDKEFKNYFIDFSNTTQSFYYINHCSNCYAIQGDFFMHSEPGGAFFPVTEYDAEKIELIVLKESGYIQLNASGGSTSPPMIKLYAKRSNF